MRLFQGVVGLGLFALAASCNEVQEHSLCTEICEELRECADDELGVDSCADRCDEAIDEGDLREEDVEDCAECADEHTCRELPDECNVCDDVLPEFTSRRFED